MKVDLSGLATPAPIGAADGPYRPEVIMAAIAHDRADVSPSNDPERARQVRQAEELLFSEPSAGGFAKALFRGVFRGDVLFPYPELPTAERAVVEEAVTALRNFADASIDAAEIDRSADIPRSVIDGLANL